MLSFLIWIPLLFGVALLSMNSSALVRPVAWLGAAIPLLLSLLVLLTFDPSHTGMQFIEYRPWIPYLSANYHLGVDGLSVWFVFLTALTTLIVVAVTPPDQTESHRYFGIFLILSGMTSGAFAAMDGLLFYVFFEATLIPMYFIIGFWGGINRTYAALKFFLYTLLGSLLAFLAILYLYLKSSSFAISDWHTLPLSLSEQLWLFSAFLIGFAVKVPMWPVHTWLPDAHVEAPTGGSIVLAAVMLKLGGYGFLRFSMPILPDASHLFAPWMIALSLIAVVYVGLVALVQTDMKKLVAYSSIAHMGFVTLGLFVFDLVGVQGALVQMISHGFVSAGMFACIGVLYDRLHTRQIADYGGVATVMPTFSAFFLLFCLANAGLPATSGFVGEFLVIMASIKQHFGIACIAATALILGAAYSLWMYKRVIFGPVLNPLVFRLQRLNHREFRVLLILSVLVLGFGIYPKMITDITGTASLEWLHQVSVSKLKY